MRVRAHARARAAVQGTASGTALRVKRESLKRVDLDGHEPQAPLPPQAPLTRRLPDRRQSAGHAPQDLDGHEPQAPLPWYVVLIAAIAAIICCDSSGPTESGAETALPAMQSADGGGGSGCGHSLSPLSVSVSVSVSPPPLSLYI